MRTKLSLALLISSVLSSAAGRGSGCSTVATFNLALLHRAGHDYHARVPSQVEALKNLNADVVCMQEVWLESDVATLLDQDGGLAGALPHHYSGIHHAADALTKPRSEMGWFEYLKYLVRGLIPSSPCSAQDLLKVYVSLIPCAEENGCWDYVSEGRADVAMACMIDKCSAKLLSVSSHCVECFTLMYNEFSDVVEACAPDIFERRNRLNPSGLVLMSKTPLKSVSYNQYFPDTRMTVERGWIQAEVEGVGEIICTHMSSLSQAYAEPELRYDNYTAQHRDEAGTLAQATAKVTAAAKPCVVAGDLNTGPQNFDAVNRDKNLTGEFPDNFNHLLSVGGYSAPYFSSDGRCTFCGNNPFFAQVGKTKSSYNVIDHLLAGSSASLSNARRVLDGASPALGDHYGVAAELCP